MIVLDSHAVIALLRDEPAAERVATFLRGDDPSSLTALGLAEVVDHLVRIVGVGEDDAVLDVAQLGLGEPAALSGAIARRAGLLRARHYHRAVRAVSLADCVAAETARSPGSVLTSADPHLLDMCEDENIQTIPLPDGRGRVWSP